MRSTNVGDSSTGAPAALLRGVFGNETTCGRGALAGIQSSPSVEGAAVERFSVEYDSKSPRFDTTISPSGASVQRRKKGIAVSHDAIRILECASVEEYA